MTSLLYIAAVFGKPIRRRSGLRFGPTACCIVLGLSACGNGRAESDELRVDVEPDTISRGILNSFRAHFTRPVLDDGRSDDLRVTIEGYAGERLQWPQTGLAALSPADVTRLDEERLLLQFIPPADWMSHSYEMEFEVRGLIATAELTLTDALPVSPDGIAFCCPLPMHENCDGTPIGGSGSANDRNACPVIADGAVFIDGVDEHGCPMRIATRSCLAP